MHDSIRFQLDGEVAVALPGETILDCALRLGRKIEHQCCQPETELPRFGRCRSCLVEIEGERTLKASCREQPRDGQVVLTASPQVRAVRSTMAALSRSSSSGREPDSSHPAITLDHDACIQCGLCVHACRQVQCQDVLGLAGRGTDMRVVFDFDSPMRSSACVGCGQCVEVCPTHALRGTAYSSEPTASEKPDIHVARTLCPYCCVGCHVNVHVKANKIVDVTAGNGPTNLGRLCIKGRFGQDFVHHADRLTTPLIRLPGTEKSQPVSDWRQAFRPAGWDEALDVAAAGMLRAVNEGGPDAVAFFGSLKTCNEDGYLLQKLARTAFGTNNVDHPTRLCHASSTAALLESVGSGAPTSQISECANADVVFVIGANPSTSHPVAGSLLRNAVRNGTRLIIADPRGQPLDRFAAHVLRFKPGTDVVLLYALIGVMIDEGLVNRSFIEARIEGFEDIAERCRDFPLSKAAGICGVDENTLRTVARAYASANAAMTIWGMGMTQHTHGTDNIRCLVAMALLCGHVGRPGTGLYPIRGHNNAQGAPDSGLLPNHLPDYQPVASRQVRDKFAALWGREIPSTPGLTMIEVIQAVQVGQVTALYAVGANAALCMPGLSEVRQALAKLNHLVVQDIFLTETASYADVVLPATALLEKDGTLTNIDRRVQLARAALSPPGEARADWWIIQEMARRCGQQWSYSGPSEVFDEMRRAMPSLSGITWQRLEKDGAVQYPCRNENDPGTPFLFAERFNTPSGKARLVPAMNWRPHRIISEEFPFVMTTGRTLEHHTGPMSRRATVLDALDPAAYVLMSPDDMDSLELNDGDHIVVRSREGKIETTARTDSTLPAGLVFAPYCFSESPANELISLAMDPSSKTGEMKYTAVAILKSEIGGTAIFTHVSHTNCEEDGKM